MSLTKQDIKKLEEITKRLEKVVNKLSKIDINQLQHIVKKLDSVSFDLKMAAGSATFAADEARSAANKLEWVKDDF